MGLGAITLAGKGLKKVDGDEATLFIPSNDACICVLFIAMCRTMFSRGCGGVKRTSPEEEGVQHPRRLRCDADVGRRPLMVNRRRYSVRSDPGRVRHRSRRGCTFFASIAECIARDVRMPVHERAVGIVLP